MFGPSPRSVIGILGAVLASVGCSFGSPSYGHSNNCSPVDFHISATAQNLIFTNPPDPNDAQSVIAFMTAAISTGVKTSGTQTISGTFKIHGLYCKPTKKIDKHADTLQLLVHGATYNGTMWEGYGFDGRYNWHVYANARGYHTLAIDRLGHGLSTRPDPLTIVQGPMHVEVIHQLIQAVRGNTAANPLGKKFSKIGYVGHSLGSAIGSQILRLHPNDITAAALTGFSTFVNFTSIATTLRFVPASLQFPSRFPSLPYPYMTFPDKATRTRSFYSGAFNPAIAVVDFTHEDTVTCGEIGTNPWMLQPSTGHDTPVILVVGVEDELFCPAGGKGKCEEALNASKVGFPDVKERRFEWAAVEETGHCLTLHERAGEVEGVVDRFWGRWL